MLPALFDHILPLIPALTDRLDLGIRVLDVGCGSGMALNLLARRFPRSTFVGYDLSDEAVDRATQAAKENNLGNLEFSAKDLSHFDQDAPVAQFDLITTFDAVHDQARPRAVLKGIHKALKSDGTYLMQDIYASSHVHKNMEHPIGSLLYTVSCLHCMTVSLAQGGEGLGAMWGEEKTRELLKEAGFSSVTMHRLDHDFQNAYYVVRK